MARFGRLLVVLGLLSSAALGDVTFIHWSDMHCNGPKTAAHHAKILADINSMPERAWPKKVGKGKVGPIDLVLATGDLTDDGKADQWKGYLKLRKQLAFPSYEVMGNHDIRGGKIVEAGIAKLHGAARYSFDKGGVHFVVLNEYAHHTRLPDIKKPQLDWLRKDLESVNRGVTPVVLAVHSPPLRHGKHFATIGKSIDPLVEILAGHKAVILHGHRHKSEMHRLDKTWWVLGAGKSKVGTAKIGTFHVIRITTGKPGRITCVPYSWMKQSWHTSTPACLAGEPILKAASPRKQPEKHRK